MLAVRFKEITFKHVAKWMAHDKSTANCCQNYTTADSQDTTFREEMTGYVVVNLEIPAVMRVVSLTLSCWLSYYHLGIVALLKHFF